MTGKRRAAREGSMTFREQRALKRLARELTMAAKWPDHERLAALVRGVPRRRVLAAIEHAIADTKEHVAINERWARDYRAAMAVLEDLRPTVLRGGLRVVQPE